MKKKSVFIFIILVGSLASLQFVMAGPLTNAMNNLGKATNGTGLSDNLTTNIGTIIKGVLALIGTIFFCLTIYAGVLWMTAMGNSEQIEKSRGIVTAAIIGIAITMSAYAITYFVGSKLGGITGP